MLNSVKDLKSNRAIGHLVMFNEELPRLSTNNQIDWEATDEMRKLKPICIDNDAEMISIKVMTKPASEGGSGCQFTDLMEVALHQLKYLNGKFPCRENAITITKLEEALMWQKKRTEDRTTRGVEGKDEK